MKKIITTAVYIPAVILALTTSAFAQGTSTRTPISTTAQTYNTTVKNEKTTITADMKTLKADKKALVDAIKTKNTQAITSARTQVATDKQKLKSDTATLRATQKAHPKTKVIKKKAPIKKGISAPATKVTQ